MSRRCLVTGASRGIGRAIALELARQGYSLALNYRSNEAAALEVQAACAELDAPAVLLPFDVSDRGAAADAIEADTNEHGGYWGLVLNAGITDDAPLAMMGAESWDRVIETNLTGFFNVVKPALMAMVRLRDGGRIVSMSSVSGLWGNRGQANYAASKAGLIAATRSLAVEVAKRGITANVVAPGYIETDMVADLELEAVLESVPLKRLGKPEEVAALVGFLFEERAAYMTAQVLSVNGGMV